MESIGQLLKAERERRGLSLADVHDSTKITVQNLEAIEDDRFDYFPNRVYARAFLRDYANFLNMDSAALLTRYEEDWTSLREVPKQPQTTTPIWRRIWIPVMGMIVLALLLAAGYYGWTALERKSDSPPAPSVSAPESDEQGGATLPPVSKIPTPEPKPEPKPQAQPEPEKPAVPDTVRLQVNAVRDAWVRVKSDGVVKFEGMLAAGSSKTFEGKSSVSIRTGSAGALNLTLNDKPLPSLGAVGQIADETYKIEDVRSSTSAGVSGGGSSTSNPPASNP